MILRPLVLALTLSFAAMPMTACAQPQTATGYAMPADGTLLSVSASADATRVPDVATISTLVTQPADAPRRSCERRAEDSEASIRRPACRTRHPTAA